MGTPDGFPAGILADSLGLPDLPVTRIENSCATGNDTVRDALYGVASGTADVALMMGADKVHETPSTREHMAMVAVKNHRHGLSNPKARLRFEVTIDEVLAAPTVVTPFGVYDCALQSDGAAALLLAAEDVVDRYTDRPVWIRGVGLGLDSVMRQHTSDLTTFPATVRAATRAFSMANLTPADVDVAEVHDFFTGIELISYEDLGFAEPAEAYKLMEAEVTCVGAALPVNSSGGLKTKGHPPGATGVAQSVELVEQLRGEARNQVDRARIGLAHNIGGPTAVAAVTILEGPGTHGS